MALVTCPDCSKQISDAAQACPDCGRPMKAQAAAPAGPAEPVRVITSEDAVTTRSRGCADLIIWPLLLGVVIGLIWLASWASGLAR